MSHVFHILFSKIDSVELAIVDITLIDEIAQINCILNRMTKTLRLRNVDLSILKAEAFNKIKCRFIENYTVELKIRDDREREHVSTQIFYSFLEMTHNIIVRLS